MSNDIVFDVKISIAPTFSDHRHEFMAKKENIVDFAVFAFNDSAVKACECKLCQVENTQKTLNVLIHVEMTTTSGVQRIAEIAFEMYESDLARNVTSQKCQTWPKITRHGLSLSHFHINRLIRHSDVPIRWLAQMDHHTICCYNDNQGL
jgi:type IV secretory pathway TraG/TraD family ATPase VirD4